MTGLVVALVVLGSIAHAQAQDVRILLLHHSTGGVIWDGGVPQWLRQHNATNGTQYRVEHRVFPKDAPYGWQNYPYDYWNIWVEHAGDQPYMEEPTLEMLAREYQVISWKHCYPVSNIGPDTGSPDIRSAEKRMENYVLQYAALKEKMRQFPQTRFLVWTGAALSERSTTQASALRARAFFDWVRREWDEPGDNIYLWDLYELETEGGLYLKPEHAAAVGDSHPGDGFARAAAPLLGQRLVDVIEGRGDYTSATGRPTAVSERAWGQVKTGE